MARWRKRNRCFRVGHHGVDVVHKGREFCTVPLAGAWQVNAHFATDLPWVRTEDYHAVGQPHGFFNISSSREI